MFKRIPTAARLTTKAVEPYDTNGNGIPDLNIKYKEPVKNFFEVK